jgi:trans-aconitate methyltransferase
MLAAGRRAADAAAVTNVHWVVGADRDMPLPGYESVGAVVIGQALHWMDHTALFAALPPMLRPGGGVAVVTNGVPLWLQDSAWSRALRDCLADWLGTPLTRTCGTDEASQRRYANALAAAGYTVRRQVVHYSAELTLDAVIGNVYSAMGVDQLPTVDSRAEFAGRIRRALEPHGPFVERVRVTVLAGIRARGR